MLPSLTPAFPLGSLHLKPYMTWSGTFSALFGLTVIQLSCPHVRVEALLPAQSFCFNKSWKQTMLFFSLSAVFFPLQPSARAELQYIGIDKCQDCIMLMVCCDTSLITFDSFTTKVEVIVGQIWYILYSCLPQGLYI